MQRCAWLVVVVACGGGPLPPPVTNGPPARFEGTLRVQPAWPCGGAMMREDAVGPELAPAGGKLLVIQAGERHHGGGDVEVTTAADGTFTGEVPAGRYCFVLGDRGKRPSKATKHFDLGCQQREWERCTQVIDLPAAGPIALDVHEQCFSSCYRGPAPP